MIKRFAHYFKPHMGLFTADLICALLLSAINLFYPMITRRMINEYIPQGALIFSSIFLNFYNGRKWHTVNVERTAFIGYTTNIAILQKLLERYCKPSHAKKRDGSFFVHIHHVAFLDKCQRALLCCPMVLWSLTLIVMPRSASSM